MHLAAKLTKKIDMSKKITSICIFFAKIFAYVKKKQYFCTRF